jgi:hypothetical protein
MQLENRFCIKQLRPILRYNPSILQKSLRKNHVKHEAGLPVTQTTLEMVTLQTQVYSINISFPK